MPAQTLFGPIELSDSEDDDVTMSLGLSDRSSTIPNTPEPMQIDGDADEHDEIEILNREEWQEREKQRARTQESQAFLPGHQQVPYFDAVDYRYKPGMNVPLVGGDFLRIKSLTRNKLSRQIRIHGWLLKRPKAMNNQLKRDTGELALVVWAEENDHRPDLERGLEEFSIDDIDFLAQPRSREIIFTNQTFPAFRSWTKDFADSDDHWARGRLVCRVKKICYYSVREGKTTKPVQESWRWLREEESDEGCGIPDICKTHAWRSDRDPSSTGGRTRSESTVKLEKQTKRSKTQTDEELVEIEESEYHEIRSTQTTTRLNGAALGDPLILKAGDICCGAGGVSGGMEEAGFQIAFGVDSWHPAAATFRLNWPAPVTTTFEMDVSDFLCSTLALECTYCHAIHFSLPCQFFSPAHTQTEFTERDEKNIETNMIVEEALKRLRPMYATFENTSGLAEIGKHKKYYNLLIKALTDLGWNAVFKVEKLSDYGNPQKRRRLIIIASCPGMPLIDFPRPTRGVEQGLAVMTVAEAIKDINRADPLHNRAEQRQRQRIKRSILPPAEPNAPLRHLIATSGPLALHPNGKRRFTFREGMRLMRFRDCHRLSAAAKGAGDKWKLIGNAVPRDIITLIYKDIKKVLLEWFAQSSAPIALDDEEEEEEVTFRKRSRGAANAAPSMHSAEPTTLKRKRAQRTDSIQLVDQDVLSNLPRDRDPLFNPQHRAPKKQVKIEDVLNIRKARPSSNEQSLRKASNPFGDVIDLTED